MISFTQNYKFAKFGLKTEMCSNFYESWHLEQTENANYEYSTWNWWSWIIDLSKFGPNTEICSNFYEIWHLHGNGLRVIIGSEHGTIIQTITLPIIVPCSEWFATHSQNMINCLNSMLKVIKTWD